MAYTTRELVSEQTRDPYPRIKPYEDGVSVGTISNVGAAPTYEVGTPMAYNTSTNEWVMWTNGGANGTGVVGAIVYPDKIVVDATNDVLAPLMLKGQIHIDDVLVPSGESAANLLAALKAPATRSPHLDINGMASKRFI